MDRPDILQPQSAHKPAVVFQYARRPRQFGRPNPKSSRDVKTSVSSVPKKTRDLPNLSQCHACGFRIDLVDGKNRLQPLYSEWRIVLLCKKCLIWVESSVICSYCFSETSDDCLRCCVCKRRIHNDCFLKYKNVAPWSYSCSGSEFSVCVDCWVPRSMAKVNGALKRRRSSEKSDGRYVCGLGRSRLLEDGDCVMKSLEDVVKDANCAVELKNAALCVAKEKAQKKAAVARKAVELATDALDIVANKDKCSVLLCKERGGGCDDKVVDNEELTFQLRCSMNSSPRMSKNFCSVNKSCTDVPRTYTYVRRSPAGACGPGNATINGKQEKLAFRSQCSVSSSSLRTSKNFCSTNKSCTEVPRMWTYVRRASAKELRPGNATTDRKLQSCMNGKLCEVLAPESSCLARMHDDSTISLTITESVDAKSSEKLDEFMVKSDGERENTELLFKEEEGCFSNFVESESHLCCEQNKFTESEHKGIDVNFDRFMIKYRKRSLILDRAPDKKFQFVYVRNHPHASCALQGASWLE